MTGALVIGANCGGLGIARSLGRRGIPVWVMHHDGHVMAAVSRYARNHLPWPVADDEATRLDYLLSLCARHRLHGWAIYPTDDEGAALIARHEQVLSEEFLLTTPCWEVMRWAYDKRLTYALAAQVGIDHPWTRSPGTREEVASLDCSFPVILKPAIKDQINSFTLARAWRVQDERELLERYDEACELNGAGTIMVQELIPGGGEAQFSFAALCDHGRPVAWLVARRVRQYPSDFGYNSTFVETVHQPAIEEPSRRIISATRYHGLVELEYKLDPYSGRPKLLDINPRTWTWHALGRRAGVDFPHLSWQLLHGENVPETRAQPGVRWVRGLTDLSTAFSEMRKGGLSPREYLHSLRPPLECAIFAFDDPLPAAIDIPSALFRVWRRKRIWRGVRRLAPRCAA